MIIIASIYAKHNLLYMYTCIYPCTSRWFSLLVLSLIRSSISNYVSIIIMPHRLAKLKSEDTRKRRLEANDTLYTPHSSQYNTYYILSCN